MNGQVIVGNIIWMRNDYVSDISFGGITYPTLEHAFQAAKVLDPPIKQEIADAETVKEARRLGRSATLRPDWDDSREKVMEVLLRLKFTQNQELATRLAKTGSAEIVMEGYDDYWGTGKYGDGQNRLGEILEEIRTEVQAITGISGELEDKEDDSADEVINGPLKTALSDCPSDELIDACQQMYDGALALMTLVDKNDYDANLIARRTGIPLSVAQDAVAKLQKMQGAVSFISDKLGDGAVKIFDIGESDDDEDDFDSEEDPLTDDGDWFSLS